MDRIGRDARLVVRAQLGDRRALAELVGHWHDPVWRYVRRMLDVPGAADDVSQEAWASALRALPGLKQPERFAPWLFTIARRSVLNQLRLKYATADLPMDDQGHPGRGSASHTNASHGNTNLSITNLSISDEVSSVLDRAQLTEGLAELPTREREVLILFYLHDLALEECAQILEIPLGTVKSRLFRARRLLHDRMIEKGYSS